MLYFNRAAAACAALVNSDIGQPRCEQTDAASVAVVHGGRQPMVAEAGYSSGLDALVLSPCHTAVIPGSSEDVNYPDFRF